MKQSKHYRLTDKIPTAIITVGGNEKKIYEGNQVFLNDGDNFEIRFFNPLQEKIGVEILFNGQSKNEGLLVLRPGEDITLDRFIGEKKKMKFDTYTIDGGDSVAVKAAEINGLVEFKFYKENAFTTTYNPYYNKENAFTTTYNPYYNLNSGTNTYGSRGIVTIDSVTIDNISDNISYSSYSDYIAENLTQDINYSGYLADSTTIAGNPKGTRNKSFKKETGRVEKGPDSTQEMKTVDANFNIISFHSINYQMKPNSQKQTSVTEVRNYCSQCSYRIRKTTWKFCPKCGNNLD